MSAAWRSGLGVSALIAVLGIGGHHAVAAAPSALRGIAIDETLDAPPVLSEAMARETVASGLPLLVRLTIDESTLRGGTVTGAFGHLDARLELYRTRDVTVMIALGAFPASDADVVRWLESIRSIAGHLKGLVGAYQVGEATRAALVDADRYAFMLKRAVTEIKSVDAGAIVLQGPIPVSAVDFLTRTYRAGVAPYSDGVAFDLSTSGLLALSESQGDAQARRAVEDATRVVEREDPNSTVVVGSVRLPGDAVGGTARFIESQLRTVGTGAGVVAYTSGTETLRASLTAAAQIADVVGRDVVALEASMAPRFLSGDADISARVSYRLLYSPSASSTYLVYWAADTGSTSIELEITTSAMTTPAIRDPLTGETRPIPVRRLGEGARLRLTLPAAGHALILDFNAGEKAYASRADVRAEALPRVEEIIARAQQVQAAQDTALTRYVAHVRVETHFRPVPADPAYNVVTENRLFVDRSGVEWEELSFSVNGATWTANRPGFPLLQPEKVLSLPLDLRLNQDYTYRLEGLDRVGGREAFAIAFAPTSASRALYRGTVWIDRQAFVRLKVDAVETHLTGTVVSNEETEIFAQAGVVAAGVAGAGESGRPVWLLDHVTSRQVLLIAGRSVSLEREVRFTEVQLNPMTFEETRTAARASDRIMYRDTDKGLRYLVKQGDTRVVSDTLTTSARALVMGADFDPSFVAPVPIAGFDLLDFNFLKKKLQLALLFGGVLGTGNIQRAGLFGGKVNASLDFFGIAIKSQDVVLDSAGERIGDRVLSIPASVGFNVGWQFTAFQKITARYELRYDAYFRDPQTAPEFVLPSNTATNGLEAGYEYRRRGYVLTSSAATYRRSTWNYWGTGDDFDPSTQTYLRYQAQASKDFNFATFHTIHVNAAYFSGERLDRFSSYRFGLFDDTKIHGMPSAIRFGELAMVRGSYSFNLFNQYRLEASLDRAIGQDVTSGERQPLTGVGLGFNLRGPRNTILRADIGKSFLPAAYRGAGSYRILFMLLKPLK